jgi:hypothetical protein
MMPLKLAVHSPERKELEHLAAMPDSDIDTSDIAEVTSAAGGVRGRFLRADTHPNSRSAAEVNEK